MKYAFSLLTMMLISCQSAIDFRANISPDGVIIEPIPGDAEDTLPLEPNKVVLSWTPNTESDLAGYIVYHSEKILVSFENAVMTDVGLNTTHEIENLKRGITHYFAVSAYDFSGNESELSDSVEKFIEDGKIKQ